MWTDQEVLDEIIPVIIAAPNLDEFKTSNTALTDPGFIVEVISSDKSEKIFELLYSKITRFWFY